MIRYGLILNAGYNICKTGFFFCCKHCVATEQDLLAVDIAWTSTREKWVSPDLITGFWLSYCMQTCTQRQALRLAFDEMAGVT